MKLKILIIVDPFIEVPPTYYGGIERIVYNLVNGLNNKGHDIILLANPASKVPVKLVPYKRLKLHGKLRILMDSFQVREIVKQDKEINIVHSFGRLSNLILLKNRNIPLIQSYQRYITPRSINLGIKYFGKYLNFTSCSKNNIEISKITKGKWNVIHNFVDIQNYAFSPSVEKMSPLVFLGRVQKIKGAHTAIKIARNTGKKLIIAGNYEKKGAEYEYFNNEILPYCDGSQIKYIGPVNDNQKNELLGNASALLFPIEWEEPFGIVMIESLACGTPVIAFNKGAVQEVVQNGETGFICNNYEEMEKAVSKIEDLDRSICRKSAENSFSTDCIVNEYEKLYINMVESGNN